MNILWLSEIKEDSLGLVGNKALKLSKLYNLGIPIPSSFVITSKCFKNFLGNNYINKQIYPLLYNLDTNNFKLLNSKVEEINDVVMKTEFSESLKQEILEAYDNFNVNKDLLGKVNKKTLDLIRIGRDLPYIALRSSVVNQFQYYPTNFLNVKGISSLITNVKRTWSSLFNFDNIYTRVQQGINHEDTSIAIIIQKMINSERSGIVYSNKQDNEIKIEVVNGMSELLLNKFVTPSTYTVDNDLKLKDSTIIKQSKMLVRNEFGGNTKVNSESEPKLSNKDINTLATYYRKLQEFYKKDVSFEFAIENSKINILDVKEDL